MNFSENNIDIPSIVRDVIKNFWVVILAVATAYLAVQAFYTVTYEPQYESTATLSVTMRGENGGSFSSLYLTGEMAEIFSEVFESSTLKNIIAHSMGVESINGQISVGIIADTNLITLKVVSDTPEHAYVIINSALDNYSMVSDYLFSNARLDALKAPTVPYEPSNPLSTLRACQVFMALAALLSIGGIAFLSYMRPTVKSQRDAKERLEGRTIGVIPFVTRYKPGAILKKGIKHAPLINSIMVGAHFVEATKKVATLFEAHMRHRSQKSLLVTSVDPNEGKSSVSSNIAIAFAKKGFKTLLIDVDLKKPSIHKIFNKNKGNYATFTECIEGKRAVEEALIYESENLYLLCQFNGVHDSGSLICSQSAAELMHRFFNEFDYVIVDTPPMNISADAEIMLKYCDAATVVVRQDWSTVGVINDVGEVLKNSGKDFVGFVVNAFRGSAVSGGSGPSYFNPEYRNEYRRKREVRSDGREV